MKKFLSLLLVSALLLTPIIGLAATVNETGLPIVDEPVTLTAAVAQSPIQVDYNEVVVLKNFSEKSNVHIEFQNIPLSDRDQQLSLMLASGDLPDILMKMNVSATNQAKYAEEGLFIAISDYAHLTPNLNRWFEEFPTAKQALTQADGKYYAAPYLLAGDAIRVGTKMFFNTDVLQKVGYDKIPSTTDELIELFRKMKNIDYNENGQVDEIPLSGSDVNSVVQPLLGSFGLQNRGSSHPEIYVDEEGVLQYAWNSDRFKEMLTFLHTLYSEKLLDQDIFTMDFQQLIAKASTGRVLTYCMVNNSPVSNTPYEEFSLGITEPFEGPSGHKIWSMYALPARPQGQFMVSSDCKNPEAAIRWMDHWYSDEGIIEFFMGIEGVTYEKDDNSPGGLKLTDYVLNNPDGLNFEQALAPYVPWAGGANNSVGTNEYFKGGETWPAALTAVEGLRNYFPEEVWPPFTSAYSAAEADEMGAIWIELKNYRDEWRAYFITGQKSLETDWEEYVNGHTALRLDRYMELYRGAMEKGEFK